MNDTPFALMQDCAVHGRQDHYFARLPKGPRGIDQHTGEPEMIGHGHGLAFIGRRIQALFDASAAVIATDPYPDIACAIAVYRRPGIQVSGSMQETEWGLILPILVSR